MDALQPLTNSNALGMPNRESIEGAAGRIARHDPPASRGELVSCPGSRARVVLGASAPALDGFALPEMPGQLPLF